MSRWAKCDSSCYCIQMKPSHPSSTDALIPLSWLICREVKEEHAKLTRGAGFHPIPRARRPPWFREYIRLAACFRTFNSQWVYFFGCVCTGMLKERCGEGRHRQLWIIYDISESWKHFFFTPPPKKLLARVLSQIFSLFISLFYLFFLNRIGPGALILWDITILWHAVTAHSLCWACTAVLLGWGGGGDNACVSNPPPSPFLSARPTMPKRRKRGLICNSCKWVSPPPRNHRMFSL